jgi:hypothetical protein
MSVIAHKALDFSIIRRAVRPIWQLALARNLIIVELYSAGVAGISWGIVPLLPGDTFAGARAYHAIVVIMQAVFGAYAETGCGLLFLLFGMVQALSYVFDWHAWRLITATCGALIWSFIGAMLVAADYHSTGWWTYLSLGGFLMWVRIRLALRN